MRNLWKSSGNYKNTENKKISRKSIKSKRTIKINENLKKIKENLQKSQDAKWRVWLPELKHSIFNKELNKEIDGFLKGDFFKKF